MVLQICPCYNAVVELTKLSIEDYAKDGGKELFTKMHKRSLMKLL